MNFARWIPFSFCLECLCWQCRNAAEQFGAEAKALSLYERCGSGTGKRAEILVLVGAASGNELLLCDGQNMWVF